MPIPSRSETSAERGSPAPAQVPGKAAGAPPVSRRPASRPLPPEKAATLTLLPARLVPMTAAEEESAISALAQLLLSLFETGRGPA